MLIALIYTIILIILVILIDYWMIFMKECPKCNIMKPISQFSGISSVSCKACYSKVYYKENKDRIRASRKKHFETNKRKRQEYEKQRYSNDINYRIARNIRARTRLFLKSKTSYNKSQSFKNYIGCDIETLKLYLESKFKPGMSWENYGKWHIDHIVPLNSAKNVDEMYQLCHYNNLQPLWAEENISKGGSVNGKI